MADWRWGGGFSVAYTRKVAPDVFAARLDALQKQRGGDVSAAAVVEAARPDDADIHGLFEWDDAAAAEAHRILQARNALNSLRRVEIVREEVVERIAWVHVVHTERHEHTYVPWSAAAEDEGYRQQVLEEALRYLAGFRKRYAHLQEMAPVLEAVEAVQAQLSLQPESAGVALLAAKTP